MVKNYLFTITPTASASATTEVNSIQEQLSLSNLGRGRDSDYAIDNMDGLIVLNPATTKFRSSFHAARLDDGQELQLRYLRERYQWLNKVAFNSCLTMPTIAIGVSKRTWLGAWYPISLKIGINPRLFQLANESTVLGTLIHEMAHQFESCHHRRPTREDAHGATWQLIMLKLGLTARAEFYGNLNIFRKVNSVEVGSGFEITF